MFPWSLLCETFFFRLQLQIAKIAQLRRMQVLLNFLGESKQVIAADIEMLVVQPAGSLNDGVVLPGGQVGVITLRRRFGSAYAYES
jgi:hypothetical protein